MSHRDQLERLQAVIYAAHGEWGSPELKELKPAVATALDVPGPAGDPESLSEYAAGYSEATRSADQVHGTVLKVAGQGLPVTWVGTTSELASSVIMAVGRGISDSAGVLDAVSGELMALGRDLGAAKQRHERGRSLLSDAEAMLAELAATTAPTDVGGSDSDRMVAPLVAAREGIDEVLDAAVLADDACHRFARELNQHGAEATAARLTGGGLTNTDQIMLGAAAVPEASHGQTILSVVDMSRASAAMDKLHPADRTRLLALLARCKSPQEGAYLLKALAAGHNIAEVTRFDRLIHEHGDDPAWLRDRLSPVAAQPDSRKNVPSDVLYGGKEWTQGDRPTCVAASTVLARAMVDPVYALHLTTGDHPNDPRYDNPDAFAERLRVQQERVYDDGRQFYHDWPVVGHEGMFIQQSRQVANSEIGTHTGHAYRTVFVHDADDRRDALTGIENSVDRGVPVLIGVRGESGKHQLTIIGHDGDQLEIYNSYGGSTMWVSEDDFVKGHLGKVHTGMPDAYVVQIPQ